jgi:hypothetical protein
MAAEGQGQQPLVPAAREAEGAFIPPVLPRHKEAVRELGGLRGEELMEVSRRLGRMSKRRWDRWFTGAGVLLAGGLIGGAFGLIPFLTANPGPTAKAKIIYLGALAASFVLAVVCGLASLGIKGQREDSVTAIKEDFDRMLRTWGLEPQPMVHPGFRPLVWWRGFVKREEELLRRERYAAFIGEPTAERREARQIGVQPNPLDSPNPERKE